MRAKMTAKLCQASFIAGAVLSPPMLRKTKQQADKMAHSSARGYVKTRERVRRLGEATGKPGQIAVVASAFAAQAAKNATDRWWELVAQAESEIAEEKSDKFGHYLPPETVTTIKDYIGSPG